MGNQQQGRGLGSRRYMACFEAGPASVIYCIREKREGWCEMKGERGETTGRRGEAERNVQENCTSSKQATGKFYI